MSRFNGGKLPRNSRHFYKKSEDKAVPGKRSFKRWVSLKKFLFVYLWLYRLVLCFVTVFLAKLSNELRSVDALNMFELIQIFKALTAGCDVGFCVWPRWNIAPLTQILRLSKQSDSLPLEDRSDWYGNLVLDCTFHLANLDILSVALVHSDWKKKKRIHVTGVTARKRARASDKCLFFPNWFWFYFLLVQKVSWLLFFSTSHRGVICKTIATANCFRHNIELCAIFLIP